MDNKNIAQEIVKGVSTMKNIFLRPVAESDCALLFEWRNELVTRQNSFNKNEIAYEEHQAWFEKMLSDKNRKQYILEFDGMPVGQIRVSVDGKNAEISYNVSEAFQGKGVGTKMINLIGRQIQVDFPQVKTLIAKIKVENFASRKAVEKNSFKEKFIVYTKDIDE